MLKPESELEAFPAEAEGRTEFLRAFMVLGGRSARAKRARGRFAHKELTGEEGSTAATTWRDRDQNLTLRDWGARWERN